MTYRPSEGLVKNRAEQSSMDYALMSAEPAPKMHEEDLLGLISSGEDQWRYSKLARPPESVARERVRTGWCSSIRSVLGVFRSASYPLLLLNFGRCILHEIHLLGAESRDRLESLQLLLQPLSLLLSLRRVSGMGYCCTLREN